MGDNLDDLLDYAASCGAPWVEAARAELAELRRKARMIDGLRAHIAAREQIHSGGYVLVGEALLQRYAGGAAEDGR